MAAHPELATEQEHLEEVLGLLDRTIEQGASMGDAGVSRRDTTRLAIRHEARRKELEGARDQVYFGKLQHEQRGPLYIGRMAIMDGESRARVISWRTPAARAYYEATADRPMGCTLRRSLDVRGRTVRSLRDEQFDGRVVAPATPPGPVTRPLESVAASEPEVAPQPEPAPPSARKAPTPPDRSHRPAPERRPEQREEPPVERARPAAPEPQSAAVPGPATEPAVAHPPAADSVLAEFERARGDAMHDIVASIQADQYRLIREEREGVLVIQGGPGTGKTAVALHRAAWLLFHHQEELVRSRVLVVGPNRAFMDFVAEVLPSLGESAVEQRPIGGLVHASITGEPERHAVRRLKGDPRMVGLLDRAVRNYVRLPRRPIDVDTGSERVRLADPTDYIAPHADSHQEFVRGMLASGNTTLLDPAPSALALTVGALGMDGVLKLGETVMGGPEAPSINTRRGPGVARGLKPEVAVPGGTMALNDTVGFADRRQLKRIVLSHEADALFA